MGQTWDWQKHAVSASFEVGPKDACVAWNSFRPPFAALLVRILLPGRMRWIGAVHQKKQRQRYLGNDSDGKCEAKCINMSQTLQDLQECQAAGMLASTLGSSNTRPESGKSAAIPAECCSDLLGFHNYIIYLA